MRATLCVMAITATMVAGCATDRAMPRTLRAVVGPSGEVFYDLTGHCDDDASCKAVVTSECGAGMYLSPPSQNSLHIWLFQCLKGPPHSIRQRDS